MLSVLVSVATKRNSSKLQLCINHCTKPFPLNALIDKKCMTVPLDDLQSFGRWLLDFHKKVGPDVKLVAIKSDAKEAYCTCSLDPRWQIKQVVKIQGSFNVNWFNNFSDRGAGGIWGSVFSLVLWIASFVYFISNLFTYINDVFTFDLTLEVSWYLQQDVAH